MDDNKRIKPNNWGKKTEPQKSVYMLMASGVTAEGYGDFLKLLTCTKLILACALTLM